MIRLHRSVTLKKSLNEHSVFTRGTDINVTKDEYTGIELTLYLELVISTGFLNFWTNISEPIIM